MHQTLRFPLSRSQAGRSFSLLGILLLTAPAIGTATPGSVRTVKPGDAFVGWSKLGENDWPTPGSALVVRPLGKTLTVRREAKPGASPLNLVEGTSVSGKLGLLAVGETTDYWKVLLPVRPNGTVGWVSKNGSLTEIHTQRIVIDLSKNKLQFFNGTKLMLEETVATGTNGTPTPPGLFFVKSIIPQKNPAGAYGPWVLVTSGFSTTLKSFAGGAGAIGLHGTSAPGKLGQNVSHGCVRLRNQAVSIIATAVKTGTPIEIVTSPADIRTVRWATSGLGAAASTETGSKTSVPAGEIAPAPSTTTSIPTAGGVEARRPPVTALP